MPMVLTCSQLVQVIRLCYGEVAMRCMYLYIPYNARLDNLMPYNTMG